MILYTNKQPQSQPNMSNKLLVPAQPVENQITEQQLFIGSTTVAAAAASSSNFPHLHHVLPISQEIVEQPQNQFNCSLQQPVHNNVQHFSDDCDDSWIFLKLDDKLFSTQRSTLVSAKDSFFAVMFRKNSPFSHARDENHPNRPFLIDRSPAHFTVILNYLRTGELLLDPAVNLRGVLLDARFYNLPELVQQLQELIDKDTCEAELTRLQIVKSLSRVQTGTKMRLQGINLTGLDLSQMDLSNVNFRKSNLTRCNLSGANLEGADMRKCLLHAANLTGAKMKKAIMRRCKALQVVLDNADLQEADLSLSDLSNASLRFANLGNANMSGTMMHHADLSGANLKKTILKGAILTGIERNETYLPMGGVIY